MNLKTYQAKTMAEALSDMKRELGRDAVILHTRSFRKGGLLGLGGRPMWEITAAPHANIPLRGRYVSSPKPHEPLVETAQRDIDDLAMEELTVTEAAAGAAVAAPRGFIGQQMVELRQMVESLLARQAQPANPDMPAELVEFYTHLLSQDVAQEVADELMRQLRLVLTGQQMGDRQYIREQLTQLVVGMIGVVDAAAAPANGSGKVIALIGPTGVGKTTTIAKLAANFKLREGKRVGLITIDTYRIAAVDQLRTYAEIIDVPLQTVLTAGELHQTVRSMRDLDVVLIDTAGRSQNDRLRLNQLRGFLSAAEADEVHLVISATANRKCATSILERFIPLGANKVILTKLDEAANFGSILNISSAAKVAISYVTAGQDVPEDIMHAEAHRLARWIMTGSMGEGEYAS